MVPSSLRRARAAAVFAALAAALSACAEHRLQRAKFLLDEGQSRARRGDPEGALRAFGEAERAVDLLAEGSGEIGRQALLVRGIARLERARAAGEDEAAARVEGLRAAAWDLSRAAGRAPSGEAGFERPLLHLALGDLHLEEAAGAHRALETGGREILASGRDRFRLARAFYEHAAAAADEARHPRLRRMGRERAALAAALEGEFWRRHAGIVEAGPAREAAAEFHLRADAAFREAAALAASLRAREPTSGLLLHALGRAEFGRGRDAAAALALEAAGRFGLPSGPEGATNARLAEVASARAAATLDLGNEEDGFFGFEAREGEAGVDDKDGRLWATGERQAVLEKVLPAPPPEGVSLAVVSLEVAPAALEIRVAGEGLKVPEAPAEPRRIGSVWILPVDFAEEKGPPRLTITVRGDDRRKAGAIFRSIVLAPKGATPYD